MNRETAVGNCYGNRHHFLAGEIMCLSRFTRFVDQIMATKTLSDRKADILGGDAAKLLGIKS